MAIAAGLCACGLPGIVLAIGLAFVPQVVVLEKLPATQALTRAWHLSRGDRFRMLRVMLLVSVALVGVRITFSVLGHLLLRSDSAAELFARVATIPVYPLLHIALVLVYFDNRVRKEGFDLALLAAQIATGEEGPAPPQGTSKIEQRSTP
jgi:hypothetical protein